ncbi:NPCBM/NEW2 domain-containing protein [bacterium]|nr:NPCBM/NEW2 domain-containing protein [bacterium]
MKTRKQSVGSMVAVVLCLTLAAAAQAGVVAHWSFDETSGTSAADSTGTLNANAVLKTATSVGGGVSLNANGVHGGSSVSMSGVAGNYMRTPYINGIHTTDYTIAAWTNQRDTGANTVFADWQNQWAFRLYTQGGELGYDQRSPLPYGNSVGGFHGTVPTNSWQHVAFTWDSAAKTARWYINGSEVDQATTTRTNVDVIDNNRDYHIGWKQDGGDTFNGHIDELWVLDERLSLSQIQATMQKNDPFAGPPSAQRGRSIGIDFVGRNTTSMGADERAGIPQHENWNNATGATGTLASLTDNLGKTLGATATWAGSPTVWDTGILDLPGDHRMMRGYLDTGSDTTTTIDVTGVPFENYYVLTYFDGSNGAAWRKGNYTLSAPNYGSVTVAAEDNENTNFSGKYNHLNGNVEGNYIIHAMLQGDSSFTLSATPTQTRAPINGIQIVDLGSPATRLDLADIVGGGDGRGNGTPGGSITPPSTGFATHAYPFVDGTFAPAGTGVTPISSTGLTYDFSALQSGDTPYSSFFNGVGGISDPYNTTTGVGDFTQDGRSILSAHAPKGITFDLEAMGAAQPGISFDYFTAIVGDSRTNGGGSISYFVLLDGAPAVVGELLTNSEEFLWVDIPRGARFLSLVMTDSGDNRGSDHAYWVDPFLHFTPEPGTLTLLGIGGLGALIRRRRRRK